MLGIIMFKNWREKHFAWNFGRSKNDLHIKFSFMKKFGKALPTNDKCKKKNII